jgi:hypothetical protein
MTDSELHPYVEWIAREARRPVTVDAAARARLLEAVRREPAPVPRSAAWRWLVEPRRVALSPLATAAVAAGLVGIGVVLGPARTGTGDGRETGLPPVASAPDRAQLPASRDTVVTFVFLGPNASKVSVVGDFNDWNVAATPMVRSGDVWTVTVPVATGRHLYSFVVRNDQGEQWVADPHAPLAPDEGFGHTNSVLLVAGKSSL